MIERAEPPPLKELIMPFATMEPSQLSGCVSQYPSLGGSLPLVDLVVNYCLEHGSINTNNPLFPRRISNVLQPGINLDFEEAMNVINVFNRVYCGNCTQHRHDKILKWICNNRIDFSCFQGRKLLAHFDEFVVQALLNKPKYARKLRRYYKSLPQSQSHIEHLIGSQSRTLRQDKKKRDLNIRAARQLKEDMMMPPEPQFLAQVGTTQSVNNLRKSMKKRVVLSVSDQQGHDALDADWGKIIKDMGCSPSDIMNAWPPRELMHPRMPIYADGVFGTNCDSYDWIKQACFDKLTRMMTAQIGFDIRHNVGFDPAISHQLEQLLQSLTAITGTVRNTAEVVNGFTATAASSLSSHIIGLVTMFISLFRAKELTDMVLAIVSYFSRFINYIGITMESLHCAMNKVAEWVRQKIGTAFVYTTQASSTDMLFDFFVIVADSISHIAGIPKSLFSAVRPHAGVIRDLSMILTGIDRLSTFVMRMITAVVDSIKSFFCPTQGQCEYLDYVEDIRLFLNPDNISKLRRDDMPAVVRKTTELYNKGLELNTRIKKEQDPVRVQAFIRSFSLVGSLLKTLAPYFFTDKLRISPFIICLKGGSGVGKSHLNQMIPSALYSHPSINVAIAGSVSKYKPGEDVYVRNFSEKYWDGYRNQRVVIFDDYLQMRDEETISESLHELIKVSNNNPYPLNMADVAEKGCVRFTSDMVMITTNAQLNDHELRNHVQNPTAITRRIHETIEVSLQDAFKDDRGVYSGPKEFTPQAWEFTVTGIPDKMNLIELIEYLAPRFLDHRLKDHNMIEANDNDCSYDRLKEMFQAQAGLFGAPTFEQIEESIEGNMSNHVDDLPEFVDFRDDVRILMDNQFFECQGGVAGGSSSSTNPQPQVVGGSTSSEGPQLRGRVKASDVPNLIDDILRCYRNGHPLGILGLSYDEYVKERLDQTHITIDGVEVPTKSYTRGRQLLMTFHPDHNRVHPRILAEGGGTNYDQDTVSRIVIWLFAAFQNRTLMDKIYGDRFFSPNQGQLGYATDCKRYQLPDPENMGQAPWFTYAFTRSQRQFMIDPARFSEAGSGLNRIYQDVASIRDPFLLPEYDELTPRTEEGWRSFSRYINVDGIHVEKFWSDFFPVTRQLRGQTPGLRNTCYYQATADASRNNEEFLKATMAYFASMFVVALGLDAQSANNVPQRLISIGAAIKKSITELTPMPVIDYLRFHLVNDLKSIGHSLWSGYLGAAVTGRSCINQLVSFNFEEDTIYSFFSRTMTFIHSYLTCTLAGIGVFTIVNLVFNLFYGYFKKDEAKGDESISEAYIQEDPRSAVNRVITEGYAQKDARPATNRIITEGYTQKDAKPSTNRIISESSSPLERCKETVAEGKISMEDIESLKYLRAEVSADPSAVDLMTGKIRTNMVRISVNARVPFTLNGLFVGGKILMTTHHLIRSMETLKSPDSPMPTVDIIGKTIKLSNYDIVKDIFHIDEQRDLIFVNVHGASNFVDIIKHFYKDEEFNKSALRSVEGTIVSYANSGDTVFLKLVNHICANGPVKYTLMHNKDFVYQLNSAWQYQSDTTAGDCGGPLVLHNKSVVSKILGIHVAGWQSRGVSTPVTQKYIEDILHKKNLRVPRIDVPLLPVAVSQLGIVGVQDKTQYFGEVPNSIQYRVPTESKLQKSPFYEVFPSNKKPAHLRPFKNLKGEMINPLRMQIEKQFVENIVIDEDIKEEAYNDFNNLIQSQDSPYKHGVQKVFDEDVTLNGVAGDDHIAPMNIKTSAGYPWIFYTQQNGKKDFVDGEPGSYLLKPDIREYVGKIEEELSQGIIRPFFWADCLKDEKRPIEKVDSGKTRVFNVGPFELTYLTRKYMGCFLAHLAYNRLSEVSIGVNPHSVEWSAMRSQLERFKYGLDGKERDAYLMCGDYANYDKRLPYCLIELALKIMNNWYGDDPYGNAVRESIFVATFNGLHICKRSVYRCGMGNPSGCGLTSQINSLVNSLLARIVFGIVGKEQVPPVPMSKFTEYVVYKSYGDDNLASVSAMAPWFNMKTFAEVCARFGVTYTTASKGDIDQDYISWDDASFLKRRFVKESNTWCWAPLEMESITEMMMWIKNSEMSLNDIMQATFNSFCNELGHYDKETFDSHVAIVQKRAHSLDMHLVNDTFAVTQMKIKTGQVLE